MMTKRTRCAWPLLPLLFLLVVCLSGSSVLGQQVSSANVSTHDFKIFWERNNQWEKVDTFDITLTINVTGGCNETISCSSARCTFNTKKCGPLPACTNITFTVTGGNFTSPVNSVITAPMVITNLRSVQKDGEERISWDNPSLQSTCHNQTKVQYSYNGYSRTKLLQTTMQNLSLPLCVLGSGEVKVQTIGGSGISKVVSDRFANNKTDVKHVVHIIDCKPQGCTNGNITWSYNNKVCPAAKAFVLQNDGKNYTINITSTSFNMTGLGISKFYNTCLTVQDAEFDVLDIVCRNWSTTLEVVENLQVEANGSTSLLATWQHPKCQASPYPTYRLFLNDNGNTTHIKNSTTNSTFRWESLHSLTEYNVCVLVVPHTKDLLKVCTATYTLPDRPTQLQVTTTNANSLSVTWVWEDKRNSTHIQEDTASDILYEVSWGGDLENQDLTEFNNYTIDLKGYNNTQEVAQVCVAVIITSLKNITSERMCNDYPFPGSGGSHLVATVVGSVVGLAVVAAIAAAVVFVAIKRRRRHERLIEEE